MSLDSTVPSQPMRRRRLRAIGLGAAVVLMVVGSACSTPTADGGSSSGSGFFRVTIPARLGDGAQPALWMPAASTGTAAAAAAANPRRPAVLLLHGCGGLYARDSAIEERYVEYAERFHAAGWHVLAADSYSGRGEGSLCTVANADRTITVRTRRGDAIAAFDWLAARPDVDATRIALVGWSNGGSTLLDTIDAALWPDTRRPVAAVAFYPGCRAFARRSGYQPGVPLLMLLGAVDDWTPPEDCRDLAQRLIGDRKRIATAAANTARVADPDPEPRLVFFPDSYHGFDGKGPVRFRPDISNGVDAKGVHVGGNPAARAQALELIDEFLGRFLGQSGGTKRKAVEPPQ